MSSRHVSTALVSALVAFGVPTAFAAAPRSLIVPGIKATFAQIMAQIIGSLAQASVAVCTVLFVVGAFYWVFSRGEESHVKTGKDLMIGSLVGLAVILGSYAILRTVFYYLYTPVL